MPTLFAHSRRRQVTVLRECIADLERQLRAARTDPVTGLPTRQHWTRLAEARFADATAVLLVDIDNFKQVNDAYGHAVGDRVLAATAAILTESLTAHGAVVGRLGGDEFAALITAHDTESAAFIDVDLIENAISPGVTVPHPGGDVAVSLSAGIAYLDQLSVRSLAYGLAAADLAMYDAKPSEPGRTRSFHPVGELVTYHAAAHGAPVLSEQPLRRVRHRDPA